MASILPSGYSLATVDVGRNYGSSQDGTAHLVSQGVRAPNGSVYNGLVAAQEAMQNEERAHQRYLDSILHHDSFR